MKDGQIEEAVKKSLARFDTSSVYWLTFSVENLGFGVTIHVRTKPQQPFKVAGFSYTFDRYSVEESIDYDVKKFVRKACGVGWCLVEEKP